MVGSCNRHKGKIPLDEAYVRKIKKKNIHCTTYSEINLSDEMEVLVIREENVKEILSGLNSGKSCGTDYINPRLLQELSDILNSI